MSNRYRGWLTPNSANRFSVPPQEVHYEIEDGVWAHDVRTMDDKQTYMYCRLNKEGGVVHHGI